MIISSEDEKIFQQQLQELEQKYGGHFAIHIDDYCKGDPYFKAVKLFEDLLLLDHPSRNAFLLYYASKDQKITLISDQKMHEQLEPLFYDKIIKEVKENFLANNIRQGLEYSIAEITKAYQQHFPVDKAQ